MTTSIKICTISTLIICILFGCTRPPVSAPERIKFNFYMRDWDATNGALLGHDRFSHGTGLIKAHYRLKESLNYSEYEIPEQHFKNPESVLSAYLSVWNPILHRALYLSEPDEKLDQFYWDSFRRYAPPRKKEDRQERLKIIMEYEFELDGISYFFSKDTLYKYTGERIAKCFCLQQQGENWYINDHPKKKAEVFFDLFCRMKFEAAKSFIHVGSGRRAYPGYDLEQPLPPSGNKYLDQEIMKIYIATHTHRRFNFEKFNQLNHEWEKQGKKGVLDYFFEQ